MSARSREAILAAHEAHRGTPLTVADAHRILHAAGIPGRRTASRAIRRLHAHQQNRSST